MRNKIPYRLALVLFLLEVVLVLVSWLLSALQLGGLEIGSDSIGVRSLLGSEGIRWFFGCFADSLATPLLVWLVVLAMAAGCLRRCGIVGALRRLPVRRAVGGPLLYRERAALFAAALVAVVSVAVMALLTLTPRAVLLSATGNLFPSPFSSSLVPAAAFALCVVAVVYGTVSGRFKSTADVCESLFAGISSAAPLFLYYILLTQLYYSAVFVFG